MKTRIQLYWLFLDLIFLDYFFFFLAMSLECGYLKGKCLIFFIIHVILQNKCFHSHLLRLLVFNLHSVKMWWVHEWLLRFAGSSLRLITKHRFPTMSLSKSIKHWSFSIAANMEMKRMKEIFSWRAVGTCCVSSTTIDRQNIVMMSPPFVYSIHNLWQCII